MKHDTAANVTGTTLDQWSGREWTGGLECARCTPLDRFAVRTRNTRYELTVLDPASGEVLVHGGRFFHEPTRVQLTGSSMGGACLKIRAVYPGLRMELAHDGETVVTSAVVQVDPIAPTHH